MNAPLYTEDMLHNAASFAQHVHKVTGISVYAACLVQLDRMRQRYEARMQLMAERIVELEEESGIRFKCVAPDAQDYYNEADYIAAVAEWERTHPVVLTDTSSDAAIEWMLNNPS